MILEVYRERAKGHEWPGQPAGGGGGGAGGGRGFLDQGGESF